MIMAMIILLHNDMTSICSFKQLHYAQAYAISPNTIYKYIVVELS